MDTKEYTSLLNNFTSFINEHRTRTNITHTSLGPPKGSFSFVGKNYNKFIKKYIKLLNYSEEHKLNPELYFVERPNSNGVTFLFIDIDYDHKKSRRRYNNNHIIEIIQTVNDIVSSNFDVSDEQLRAFVTEKPNPTKRNNKKIYKDGLHIYYPYLPMNIKSRYFVMDCLTQLILNDELLADIKYLNDPETVFDTSVVKNNGILMLGSRKIEGNPYKLTYIYDVELNNIDINEYYNKELVNLFSNQKYNIEDDVTIKQSSNNEIENKINSVYVKYNGGNKRKKEKKETFKESKHYDNNLTEYKNTTLNIMEQKDIKIAKQLCPILSMNRVTNYREWTKVGYALYSVHPSLFETFVTFSKRNMDKYNEGKVTCQDVWKAAEKYSKYYTIGSLRHWARIDNKNKYYTIIRKINDDIFARAETSKHVDISEIVYELYKDRFVCVDISKRKWYEFQGHRWVNVQSAYTLEELISNDVRRIMAQYCAEKLSEATADENGFNGDSMAQKYMKLLKMIDNLGDVKFRENVVRACSNKFYDAKFQEQLDTNEYLVGFDNGVYDLREMIFRDGIPSDCLTMTVGYDWKEYKEDDPIFVKINRFFSQVQTEEDMKEYILTFIASILRGIPDSKVHIWTGGGGNGKSATVDIIKNMLGDYFGIVPITLLTRKRGGSSNATPELADKAGKRFIVVQEPEHNDVIFVGQMKEYTGRDMILARPLYGNPFYYIPQYKIALTCNNLPTIPSTDEGTWRRLRVSPFESKFVDDNPDESKRRFLKDEELQEAFEDWGKALMWLVINKYYPKYKTGINGKRYKIAEPAKVTQFTNNYKKESDLYMEFMNDNFTKTDNKQDKELIAMVFESFREWYSTSYSDKPPPKKDFTSYLKKNNYRVDRQYIYGVTYDMAIT
jgi:P4 family phage/plasmid primase-like protien